MKLKVVLVLFAFCLYGATLSLGSIATRGRCTYAKGVYSRTQGVLSGCEYTYTIEFCPRKYKLHSREWVNSITIGLESNMTRSTFVSSCAIRNKVFVSVTGEDFKTGAQCSKTVNMTTLEGIFRTSMLYAVVNRTAFNESETLGNIFQFMLYNNHDDVAFDPITVDFQVDASSGEVTFVGPFHNVVVPPVQAIHDIPLQIVATHATAPHVFPSLFSDQHAAGAGAVEGRRNSASNRGFAMNADCDFNDLLSGQWNFDRGANTWDWRTHTCDTKSITVEAFVTWCKKYGLKSLVLIGNFFY
jgi:hypothetical protein